MLKKIHFLIFLLLAFFVFYTCNGNKSPSAPDSDKSGILPSFTPTFNLSATFMMTSTTTVTYTKTFTLTVLPDTYEEDDIPQQAKQITSGESQTRSIDACNEQDWIKFTLIYISKIEIITNAIYPTYIEVFADENKNDFIIDSGDGTGPAKLIINDLQPGTYYANIRAYNYEAPGCDIFNYTLDFNIVVFTPTHTFTHTYTETEVITYTFTKTIIITNTETFTLTSTHTATKSPTVTFTNSFTSTITPTYDSYEPDNDKDQAKTIEIDEIQYRNFWPYLNPDFISFSMPYDAIIYVSITTTTENYNFAILNSTGNVFYHNTYGPLSYNYRNGNFYLDDIDLIQGTYYFVLTSNLSIATDYTIKFNIATFTFTITPTNTYTATNTNTYTPTETPTKYWFSVNQYGSSNSGYLSMNGNENSYSVCYLNSGILYVDSNNVTTAAEGSFLASRDKIKKLADKIFVVFSDYNADIYVKSSEDNFNLNVGGQKVGRGYYPCIESNGTTIFVAYTDIEGGSDMRTSVKYFVSGHSWNYYGGDGGVYNQGDTQQRRLSMDGYYSGTLNDIYVAYITQANAGIYVKHNLNNTNWEQVGSSYVTYANNIRDVEISVVNPSNIFIAYSRNLPYFDIYVKKLQGEDWVNAGINPVVGTATLGNVEFSLYAISENEVYLTYQHPTTQKAVVKKYNGTNWEFIGEEQGISEGTCGLPKILKINNNIYCGFVDWASGGKITVMSY